MDSIPVPLLGLAGIVVLIGIVSVLLARHFRRARTLPLDTSAAPTEAPTSAPAPVTSALLTKAARLAQLTHDQRLAVAAGKLTEEGKPRCRFCEATATKPGPRFERIQASPKELIRRQFGGQERIFVLVPEKASDLDNPADLRTCAECLPLAVEDFELKAAELNEARRRHARDEEIEIAHYERSGAARRVGSLVVDRQDRDAPPASPPVVFAGDVPALVPAPTDWPKTTASVRAAS